MKKKENVPKNDKSVQCNSIKNVIAELKNEIDFLLSQKENDNFDDDFVHIKKMSILGTVAKGSHTLLN